VIAQRPKLAPHAAAIRSRVADALGCDQESRGPGRNKDTG